MKKTMIAVSLGMLSMTAQADVVGLYVGGHVWDNEATGSISESTDLQTFNFDDEQQASFYIAVEHPLPFIPNAKIAKSTLDTNGNVTLTDDFNFGDETFESGSAVDTTFDLSYVDYTLYYELFDNGALSFDFGLTARKVDSEISATSTVSTTDSEDETVTETLTGDLSVSEFIPMLYVSTEIGLMFTGMNIFAEGNFLSFDDHVHYDYQLGVSYELVDNIAVDVNLMAGYRAVKLELEDLDDLYTNLEFSGAFVGVEVHF